jgi:4-diphosphocytidyl-2-C-methyl-D-erythritol kinase
MYTYKIKSYAKINLALNVTGKSAKLHKVESIISFVDLHDLIYLKLTNSKDHKVSFQGTFSKDINKKNTVSTLLKILDKKKLLNNKKFQIKIIKNIPQQAGMGGGSMNASTLINFLMIKKIIKIEKDELAKLAKLIGSDVILGINAKNSILSSNGKITQYKKKFRLYTLIVKPNFGCSTKYIFSKVKFFSKAKLNLPKHTMFNKYYLKNLNNDLEVVAFKKYPKLKNIKSFLSSIPNTIFVRMSGSGTSIVAYFQSKKACSNGNKQSRLKYNGHWGIESKTI